MARADSTKRGGTPRGKGSYVFQACNVCRHKKSKCGGQKPVCLTCIDDGRQDECGYSGEPIRGPRTEAHFEAIRKRADALREYANLLESMLEKCRREHGGVWEDNQSYLQFRPIDADGVILPDEMDVDDEDSSNDNDAVQALCRPTEDLKLQGGGLVLFHGNTAVFRFAQADNQPISRFPAIAEDPGASYVLVVDGIDLTHYDPDFDWSRHLPAAVPLDRRAHDQILDLTFRFFTSWCLRIFPPLFLRDMHRALSVPVSQPAPKTAHYSPMLHNALIALGSGFSDDPKVRDLKARRYFASAAKNYLEAECASPNLSVVQALSILGSFHSSQGEQTLGYLFFGMSARMSQALGLGVDCSSWVRAGLISEHDRLDRDWNYWTTFTQDVCWSLYVGRDFGIQPPSLLLPVPYVDADFDQMPWHYPPANIPVQPNYFSRTFAATCQLLMIARRIMNVVNQLSNSANRHEINEELVSSIDLELNTWKSNLAPEVNITLQSHKTATPHRLMLHLAYWWLFILLHRPFFHRRGRPGHGTEIDHVKLCRRATDNIMELLGSYRSLYSLRYVPITLVQVIFSAGTVYLLMAVQALSGSRVAKGTLEQAVSQLNLCLEYLAEIGKSWQCATNIAGILKNLVQVELKPLMERRSITVGDPVEGAAASPVPSHGSGNRNTRRSSRKGRRTASKNPSSPGSIPIANPISPDPIQSPPPPVIAPMTEPLQTPSAVEEQPPHPIDLWGMNSSGFGTELLAMLGGETLSDGPFLPLFDTNNTTNLSAELFLSGNDVDYLSAESQEQAIPDTDLAFLEGLWNQLFGKV
ncbi:hypothetical protein BDN72DRAFT_247720 [Pluteus cervinus]|uniref:Uncharacterized protein n=1 Tax=Pluteus cervinus TaxID=181527 RepID=A0ACD3B834_9AGAR|nr:hypothetical protein BDN72DRAFT_247720 [Pluteus cervinus]